MEKQRADKLILEYRDKIFGFALGKTRNISAAEELASDIVCEVYVSFRKAEEIPNPDGYVYRIASNVYANYMKRMNGSAQNVDVSEVMLPFYDEGFSQIEMDGELQELRREIGYLSEKQRRVIYLHYYENKSVSEIAKSLGISPGTVKWHLSDARSALKEELIMEKYNDDLSVNPIEFASMGHNGTSGSKGGHGRYV